MGGRYDCESCPRRPQCLVPSDLLWYESVFRLQRSEVEEHLHATVSEMA